MMKRWLLFLALAGGMQVASAAGRAGEILEGLAAGFRAMKGYEVDFAVEAEEYRTAGSYAVEGQGYFLTLGDAEVFCDGTVRYEVDHAPPRGDYRRGRYHKSQYPEQSRSGIRFFWTVNTSRNSSPRRKAGPSCG